MLWQAKLGLLYILNHVPFPADTTQQCMTQQHLIRLTFNFGREMMKLGEGGREEGKEPTQAERMEMIGLYFKTESLLSV